MNREAILVIGDDPLSLQLLSTMLREKGYGNVIVGNHIEVEAELQARERQREMDDALILGIGNLLVSPPPLYELQNFHVNDYHLGWSYDRKPPPHYRVNFRTGKPLRY
jgi:CheY-like chemotaxis protein